MARDDGAAGARADGLSGVTTGDLLDWLAYAVSRLAGDRADALGEWLMAKAKAKGRTRTPALTEQLRAVIRSRRLTAYRVGKMTGVQPQVIQRFLDGRDLYGATIDRLAAALGLTLIETEDAHDGP